MTSAAGRYLFDTNAISDLMAEHPGMKTRVAGHQGRLVTSVIVQGEIYYGLERLSVGKRRSDLTVKALLLFAALPAEPVAEPAGLLYARIRQDVEAKGLAMDDNDLWIAASAMFLDAVLVTRDKDFTHVAGLSTEDWTM